MLEIVGRTFHVAGWRQLLHGYMLVTRAHVPVQLPHASRCVDGPSHDLESLRCSAATPPMVCMTRSSSDDVLSLLARQLLAVRSIVSRSVMVGSASVIEFCGCTTPLCGRCGTAAELTASDPSLVQLASS